MITTDLEVAIRRPPADVFAFVADFENLHKWSDAVFSSVRTNARQPGAGAIYRCVAMLPALGPAIYYETIEYTESERLLMRCKAAALDFEDVYAFHPYQYADETGKSAHGTVLRMTDRLELHSQVPFAEDVLAPFVRLTVEKDLQNIKRLLEL